MTPNQAYCICLEENRRKPELEHIILNDPSYSYCYARDFVQHRWIEAEPIVLTSPQCSYLYALYIIKSRWPESEHIILTDVWYSYHYAINIIKGRWPEAELLIRQNDYSWGEYCRYFNIEKEKINWKIGL